MLKKRITAKNPCIGIEMFTGIPYVHIPQMKHSAKRHHTKKNKPNERLPNHRQGEKIEMTSRRKKQQSFHYGTLSFQL